MSVRESDPVLPPPSVPLPHEPARAKAPDEVNEGSPVYRLRWLIPTDPPPV